MSVKIVTNKALGFTATTHLGSTINLNDFKEKRIWLAFFRYASCPLCNLHIHNIIKRFDEIEKKGLIFLPVFQSSPAEVLKYAGKDALPFQIICDPKEELYKLYNVGNSYSGFFSFSVMTKIAAAMKNGFMPGKMQGEISRLPSELIIDQNFDIIYRYDGKDIADHPSIDMILEKAIERF